MGKTRRGADQKGNQALYFEHVDIRCPLGLRVEVQMGRYIYGPGVQEKGWS